MTKRPSFRFDYTILILVVLLAGCGTSSQSAADGPSRGTQAATVYKPVLSDTRSDREKLLQQELELERQKAELQKQRLEQQLEFERQKSEIEREKRAHIEAETERSRREQQATRYSDSEFTAFQLALTESGDSIGQLLLARTHPTGDYSFTDKPSVSLSQQKDVVTAKVTVHWKGGFSEEPYVTAYSFRVTKRGVDRLEVLRDTALFKIDPKFLKTAELELGGALDSEK